MIRTLFCTLTLLTATLACALAADADPVKPTAPPDPEGMKPLFTKDLEGWDGNPKLWSFKDGVVRGETTKENPTKGNTFLIWKGGTLGDFDLRLTFRIKTDASGKKGNSGIQYRSKQIESPNNSWVVSGYQAEVEDTPGKVGFLYHERGRGYLCNVGEKTVIGEDGKPQVVGKLGDKKAIGDTYKVSDWNDYIIIARGKHLVHYLNGIQTIDVIDNDPKGGALSGILALQIHAGPPMLVEFKNVRLKQFESAKEK
jgi:hypothetical protein